MMNFLDKVTKNIKAQLNKLADATDDPNANLDLAYENLLESLKKAKVGIVDVTTAIKQLEGVKKGLEIKVESSAVRAQNFVDNGNADLAREAIQGKLTLQSQVTATENNLKTLRETEGNLKKQITSLEMKIQSVRAQKETLKARNTAADATVDIMESVTGTREDMESIGESINRATDAIETKEARAGAISGLKDDGVLTDVTETITVTDADVEAELAKIVKKA